MTLVQSHNFQSDSSKIIKNKHQPDSKEDQNALKDDDKNLSDWDDDSDPDTN